MQDLTAVSITTMPEAETPKQTRARKSQAIAMEQLFLSDDFRFRVADDEATISDYEEIYRQYREDQEISKSTRCQLGTITVLCQGDGKFVVVVGRLRFLAAQRAGLETLQCVVITDRDEALKIGLESNRHGLPLTGQDRALCISIAITRLSELSNRRIAAMIGCPPSTVNAIVKKYKLRSETPCVIGLDGKKYTQRKRKAVAADKTTAGKPDQSTISNGKTIETDPMIPDSARPFDKVRAVLGVSKSNDRQLLKTYLSIVKDIVAEGFSDDKVREDFLASLKNLKSKLSKK
jgi:hypothetical protein